jgi:hypothetical protein
MGGREGGEEGRNKRPTHAERRKGGREGGRAYLTDLRTVVAVKEEPLQVHNEDGRGSPETELLPRLPVGGAGGAVPREGGREGGKEGGRR